MSHSVARGKPYASQLYLDGILDEVLQSGVTSAEGRERLSLPQIMFHCLKKHPEDVFMINGATGEKITNGQILKQAVSFARALAAKGARGKTVMIAMRNHQTMAAVYFAVMFSGTLPFIMDPSTTAFEISHFLKLLEPCMVFCDEELFTEVNTAVNSLPDLNTVVNIANKEVLLKELSNGCSETIEDFQIPDSDPDDTVMMLPTSGSTGLPKATLMSHRGLVVQLPMSWCYHTQFPKPTELIMLLTTPQWVTFTMTVTTAVVYRVPVLMSPRMPTVDWVKEMLLTYRPTWTFFGPAFVKNLLSTLTEDHLSSLKTLLVLGAPSSIDLMAALKDKLPKTASLGDVYGTTETQGYITFPDPAGSLKAVGRVVNLFDYMLLDDNAQKVGLCQNGELYIKGPSTIKGYYNNQESYEETFIDGWFKTGDIFYIDENERLFYLERKKFCFKYMGSHVSPEEVELVIGSVSGVQECVVCATEDGPAAAVVVTSTVAVSRELIHKTVNDTLSEHKQLHGGIAFVASLPHTHSGKIKRSECKQLVQQLIASGECYY